MNPRYLTIDEVVHLHRQTMLAYGQQAILIAPENLDSAVARPQTSAFGQELFETIAEKAAALLQALVIAHAFLDGNKRIGLTAIVAFLELNAVSTVSDHDALYDLVIEVTTGAVDDVHDIATRITALFFAMD